MTAPGYETALEPAQTKIWGPPAQRGAPTGGEDTSTSAAVSLPPLAPQEILWHLSTHEALSGCPGLGSHRLRSCIAAERQQPQGLVWESDYNWHRPSKIQGPSFRTTAERVRARLNSYLKGKIPIFEILLPKGPCSVPLVSKTKIPPPKKKKPHISK